VTERDPIYLATDSGGDPSALATFSTGDTIPSGFMSPSLSATDITTLTGTFTQLNATGVDSTRLTSTNINVTTTLSAGPGCTTSFDGDLSISGNLSGGGNIGVIGQIMCGQTGPGTADLNIVDDNSDATVEINSGANYDSKIQFRENDAWRCDLGWDGDDNDFFLKTYTGDINLDPAAGYTVSASCSSITVSSCPIPNPVCYAQMDGAGTAGTTEIKFGAGVTPSTVTDGSDQITWDNTNKTFDIAAAGTYHVLATLVFNVAGITLPTVRIKNGATAKNRYTAHGVHSAEDPEEVTIQATFVCAASDEISVTFQDDGSTDVNLMAGSAVIVKRLF
jgi:hypothetical protein